MLKDVICGQLKRFLLLKQANNTVMQDSIVGKVLCSLLRYLKVVRVSQIVQDRSG